MLISPVLPHKTLSRLYSLASLAHRTGAVRYSPNVKECEFCGLPLWRLLRSEGELTRHRYAPPAIASAASQASSRQPSSARKLCACAVLCTPVTAVEGST